MPETKLTEQDVLDALKDITDPEIGRTLGDLNMLHGAEIGESSVKVRVELPTPAYPQRERITEAIRSTLSEKLPQAGETEVEFTWQVRGKESGGRIGLRVKNIVCVGSGKGGVGKSSIAASLALGLKEYGARVGLMDADVYGPSLPHMLGARGRPAVNEQQGDNGQTVTRIEPIEAAGLKLISIGFFVEPDKAVVWRGPMLHKAITQFLQDTDWGELDYLIVDLPPGTGDPALSLAQSVGLAGAVVVCTPQQVALLDAVKAMNMFQQVNIPVLGIVENMSGEVFGRGGAKQKAEEMGVGFLGEVPMEPEIRVRSDSGRIWELFSEDNPAREPLLGMCEQTAIGIARNLLETPSAPSLEVL